mmetsp:Transcript_62278/g.131667  ORF Transcript_62278/g.131667 Transcript_62278/m.131667 type:complete len:294 (-) Transcript_62278:28-909(-)
MTKLLSFISVWLLVALPAVVAGIGVFAESWARGAFSYRSKPKQKSVASFGSTEVQALESEAAQHQSADSHAETGKALADDTDTAEATDKQDEDGDDEDESPTVESQEGLGNDTASARRRRRRTKSSMPPENPYFDIDDLEENGFEYMWFLAGNSLSCMDSCASEGSVCSTVSERKMKDASRTNETLKSSIGEDFDTYCTKGVLRLVNVTDEMALNAPFVDPQTGYCLIPPKPMASCRSNNETVQRICLCEANMTDFPSGPDRTASGEKPKRKRRRKRRSSPRTSLLRRETDEP